MDLVDRPDTGLKHELVGQGGSRILSVLYINRSCQVIQPPCFLFFTFHRPLRNCRRIRVCARCAVLLSLGPDPSDASGSCMFQPFLVTVHATPEQTEPTGVQIDWRPVLTSELTYTTGIAHDSHSHGWEAE
jgi:hypothetical protein